MSQADIKIPDTASTEKINGFHVVGITVMTGNKDGRAADDINALWQRFFEDAIGDAIPSKQGDAIYAVYHNYKGGADGHFGLTIGCRVRDDDFALPANMESVYVEQGDYMVFAAQGAQPKALMDTWQSIWKADIPRTYKTDLEIYGPRFFEEGLHEVLVCIGVSA